MSQPTEVAAAPCQGGVVRLTVAVGRALGARGKLEALVAHIGSLRCRFVL